AILAIVYWFFGRERKGTYDREYEQEPPDDLQPALVPTLLRQGGTIGSLEFTATLFDLIRRGHYKATPVTTEKSVWGGMKHESIADLELAPGTAVELTPYEQDVATVVDSVIAGGSERLSNFRDRITDDRKTNSERFKSFKDHGGDAVKALGWFDDGGVKVLGVAVAVFGIAALILLV